MTTIVFFQLLVASLVLGSIYGLIALGYSLIYKSSGLMSFMQGDMLTIGAFLGYTFYSVFKLPYFIAILLVFLVMFFLGFAIEKGVIHQLVKKKTLPIYTVLATIAISYILQNGAMIIWGSKMLTFPSAFKKSSVKLMGINFQTEAIFCIIISVICMLILHVFMKYTKFGTALRASTMDPMAAKSCGVNVSFATGFSWGISAAMAALAGILIGPIYGVFTTLGATIGRKGFSSAVVGGYGNMYGAMVGGILLGVVETFVASQISPLKDMIAYIILLIFLFIKPTGIFNERAIAE